MQSALALLLFLLCNYSYVNDYISCEIIMFSLVQKLILNTSKLQAVLCMVKAGCVQTSARTFARRNSDSLHDTGGRRKRIFFAPVFPKSLKSLFINLAFGFVLFKWKCRFSSCCCILLFGMVATFLRSLKVGCGVLEVSKLDVVLANILKNHLYHGHYALHINMYCFKQVVSFHYCYIFISHNCKNDGFIALQLFC